jgi:hypothetical protein
MRGLGRFHACSLRSYDRPRRWGPRHPVSCRHESSTIESVVVAEYSPRRSAPGGHTSGAFLRPLAHRTAGRRTDRDARHPAPAVHRVAHLPASPPAASTLGQPLDELLCGHGARAWDELPHSRGEECDAVKTHRHPPRNSCRCSHSVFSSRTRTQSTSCRLGIPQSARPRMDWWWSYMSARPN